MKKVLLLICFLVTVFVVTWCGSASDTSWVAKANYDEIQLWHDWRNTIPQNINLPAWKDYKFVITPEENGAWCMSTIKREWTTVADTQLVLADKSIEFVMNDAQPWTYNFVCNGMGMKQWSITIQG